MSLSSSQILYCVLPAGGQVGRNVVMNKQFLKQYLVGIKGILQHIVCVITAGCAEQKLCVADRWEHTITFVTMLFEILVHPVNLSLGLLASASSTRIFVSPAAVLLSTQATV